MTPRGAEALIAMRKAGKRPAGDVWVSLGDFSEPDWWRWAETRFSPEILVRTTDPVDRLDLRCLIGLSLLLYLPTWNDQASRLYDRLTEYADEIAVLSPSFDDDIGWWWIREKGRIEWADRHILTEFRKVQDDRGRALYGKDQAAYADFTATEVQMLKDHQWLR